MATKNPSAPPKVEDTLLGSKPDPLINPNAVDPFAGQPPTPAPAGVPGGPAAAPAAPVAEPEQPKADGEYRDEGTPQTGSEVVHIPKGDVPPEAKPGAKGPIPIPIVRGRMEITTFDQLPRLAIGIAKAGMAPMSYTQGNAPMEVVVSRLVVAMAYGLRIGLDPMEAPTCIAVINNQPSLWGDVLPRRVYESQLCEGFLAEGWENLAPDGTVTEKTCAWCESTRKGGALRRHTYGVVDAKTTMVYSKGGTVPLWDKPGPWKAGQKKRMMQMRARAWHIRDVYPDALGGLSVAEEQMDAPEVDENTAKAAEVQTRIETLPAPK